MVGVLPLLRGQTLKYGWILLPTQQGPSGKKTQDFKRNVYVRHQRLNPAMY